MELTKRTLMAFMNKLQKDNIIIIKEKKHLGLALIDSYEDFLIND